jgi:hypothetical protein
MNAPLFTTFATAFLVIAVHAGPRTGGEYSIPVESADAGGGRTASASYSNDGSTGGITGVSNTSDHAARAGYIGQLYDPTGLTLSSPAAIVAEASSFQLSAILSLDDATTLAVPASHVLWSVVNGPVSGISSGGLANAGAVYQNTAASVQGSHAGLTGILDLTVIELFPDNFGIYAEDGLGDDWQVLHFGPDNPAAGPLADPDHDGYDNRFEFTAGTLPTNPLSVFLWRMETVPETPGQRRIIFSPLLSDRIYTVKSSTNLDSDSWITLDGAIITDRRNERTVTDPDTTAARKFYSVEITKP